MTKFVDPEKSIPKLTPIMSARALSTYAVSICTLVSIHRGSRVARHFIPSLPMLRLGSIMLKIDVQIARRWEKLYDKGVGSRS